MDKTNPASPFQTTERYQIRSLQGSGGMLREFDIQRFRVAMHRLVTLNFYCLLHS